MTRLFTKAQRMELWRRTNGKCTICGGDLGKYWVADHIEPYECGGPTVVDNGQPLCRRCNYRKTADDQGRIAKNTRVREKAQGIRRSRRGFATNRDGPFKMTFDKGVIRR